MKKIFLLLLITLYSSLTFADDPIKALIITGGHSFDRPAFFEMFDSFKNFSYTEAIQPEGNQLIESHATEAFDILIFYDMYDSITDRQKAAYIDLLKKGKPMIFLHHALVSYQDWPEFKKIIGGKYIAAESGGSVYRHDVNIPLKIVNNRHPVTKGLKDFTVFDETYGQCEIMDKIEPLLSTSLPESMPYVAWINSYGKSKIIYIQNGHGPQIFRDPNYRKLLQQAIKWSVKDLQN